MFAWRQACSLAGILLLVSGCATAPRAPWGPAEDAGVSAEVRSLAEAHAHYGAAVIHEMNGEADAALKQYSEAARKDPANEWLVLEVSRRLLQNKQPEQALEIVKAAASRPDAGPAVSARLGLIYLQLGRQDLAIAASRTAIQKTPTELAPYQTLFLAHVQAGRPMDALAALDQATKQPKAGPEFLVGVSEMYMNLAIQAPGLRTNASARALAALSQAAKTEPLGPALRMKIADGFSMLGEQPRAAEMYSSLLKAGPDIPLIREHIHSRLAEIYVRSNDPEKAVEHLQAMVKEDPTNPQAHYLLGSLAADQKKYAEAVEHFRKAILLKPDLESAYYEMVSAQLSSDQISAALDTLGQARKRFPASYAMEMLSGMAYSQQQAYAQAIRHYNAAEVIARATDSNRLNHVFYFQVGAAHERNGDYAEAERHFRRSLEMQPDFTEAQNYLGYMWAERGTNLIEAHALLKKAVSAEPTNAAYLDSLAWVLFKLDRPAEALPLMLKAVELEEEPDATIYDHLGDIYAALKQPEKAREAWERSLKIEARDSVKEKLGEAAGVP